MSLIDHHSTTLQACNIGKSYQSRPVVRNVTFNVKCGEIVGLLGPNGAGKTTSFYMMTGLIQPNYGQVKLDEHDITNLPMFERARLGIGYLPQEASVFRGLTVENNINAILEITFKNIDDRQEHLESLLGEFSLSHLRHALGVTLSGGERRRVEIARALAAQPHFILLDEPLAGIDPVAIQDIRNLIFKLKEKNIGVLITDHNVRETLDIVDRAYILSEGSILAQGSAEEIVQSEDVRRVYLGEDFCL